MRYIMPWLNRTEDEKLLQSKIKTKIDLGAIVQIPLHDMNTTKADDENLICSEKKTKKFFCII